MSPDPASDRAARLTATPTLERRLAGLGRRLALLVWARGAGLALVALCLWAAFAYVADYHLGVPEPVRVAHGLVLAVLPLVVLVRLAVLPARRVPGRRGLAALLERAQGGEDLFTSAADFQLERGALPPGSEPLVRRALDRAEAAAADLPPKLGVLDGRRPLGWLGAGAVALALGASLAAAHPERARIFADRLVGGDAAWPQLTFLTLDVPLDAGVEHRPDGLDVRLARGEDLPVSVTCEGRVPDEVLLEFADGTTRRLPLLARRDGGGTFGTTLRSVAQDLSFTAVGGDDRRRAQRVDVQVLTPPDLFGLALAVTPPAYTGLPARLVFDQDLEVLAGSRVEVTALVEPAGATGTVRLLPEDRVLDLAPATFPARPGAADGDGPPADAAALGFAFDAERSLRFRFELVDDAGLTNPDPGLWSVTVAEDRPPRIDLLSPAGLTLETTADGVLPLGWLVEDDFGVAALTLGAELRGAEERTTWPLELRPVEAGDARAVHGFAALSLSDLAGAPLEAGMTLTAELEALDVKAPEAGGPGRGRSSSLSVRVLAAEDYMRRVQDRLAAVRRGASELYDLQVDRQARTDELLQALVALDGEPDPGLLLDLSAAATGQRRVAADAAALTRELAGLVGDVLHARIDPEADRQLEQLDLLLGARVARGFEAETWTTLVDQHRRGRLGSAGFAGHLLDILGLGLDLSEMRAPAARAALDLAEETPGLEDLVLALDDARARQAETLAAVDALLERLAEWDNFQSVLSLTRSLLDRQRALEQRTRDLATQ